MIRYSLGASAAVMGIWGQIPMCVTVLLVAASVGAIQTALQGRRA